MEVLRHLRSLRLKQAQPMRATLLALTSLLSFAAPLAAQQQWPVKTREHVDLWLHGFALLQEDTTRVPLFAKGYRDQIVVLKNSRNLLTDLDAEHDALVKLLAARPELAGAQFTALSFGSWEELLQGFDYFLKADGDPRDSRNRDVQQIIFVLNAQFPGKEGREFARKFINGLKSERDKFHHQWWIETTRDRAPALARADSLWQNEWRPKLQRYLNHTQQGSGDLILSTALGGEGRAVTAGKKLNQFAIGFPATPADAEQLLFGFAHEAAGAISQVAVDDNLTPAQQREGLGARYSSAGLVRGGEILVEHIDPALAERYARWYLSLAGLPLPQTGAREALAAAFPLKDEMLGSIKRQLDIAFGGI